MNTLYIPFIIGELLCERMHILSPLPQCAQNFGHRFKQLQTIILLFVTPIVVLFSTAFTQPQKGPVMTKKMWIAVLITILLIMVTPATTFASTMKSNSRQDPYSTCINLPRNFDPLKASNAEIAQYGFPRRPTDNTHLTKGVYLIQHAKQRVCTSHSTGITHQLISTISNTSEENSSNWSGNIAIGYHYEAVDSYFYVPCVASSPTNAYSSHWVGLGGDGNDGGGNLIQDSIEANTNSNGSHSYYAWYEIYPYESEQWLYNVNCGDTMYFYADSNYTLGNGAYMLVEDITSGVYTGTGIPGETSNGSTAEWISERPTLTLRMG